MREAINKTWSLLLPVEQRKAIWMLLLVLLMAIAETAGVISIMPFLSVLGRPSIVQENSWLHAIYTRLGFPETRSFIAALGLVSIALVIASSAFKTITQHLINRFVQLLRHSISSRLMTRYLSQPYDFFLSRNSAELSKSILAEVDMLIGNLIQPMSQVIAQSIIVLAMLALVFAYDPWLALAIMLVVGALYSSIYILVRKRLRRMGEELQSVNKERYQSCNEALHGIREIKVMHAENTYLQRYEQASRTQARHMAATDTLSQTPLYFVEAIGYTGLIIIALTLLAQNGDIAQVLPALGLYGFTAYRMLPAAQIIYRGLARLQFASATLDHLHQSMALGERQLTTSSPKAMQLRNEIRLQGIRYAYPGSPDRPVLEDFNLVIPAKTSIGIAGKSGAGKSTLMDLLLGLLEPQAGVFTVDGVPITSSNMAAWHRSIGYVPQHIYLVDSTVAENIAFGVPKDQIDMQAVERASRMAQVHDFVTQELPNSYETMLGDRGIRLSGGQRQRVGIARALYRDPPVLFMDEATSALDVKTEEIINSAIRELSKTKTLLIISHRETSLQECEQVIRL